MSVSAASWLLLVLAIVAANLPWLSERVFFVFSPPRGGKRVWMRLVEWALLLVLMGLLSLGLERRLTGQLHNQGWEFYTVGICLFLVFALPGFIYRHELRKHLDRRR